MQELFEEYSAYHTKRMLAQKREEAYAEGLEEEMLKSQRTIAQRMSNKGFPIEEIADVLEESEETIKDWVARSDRLSGQARRRAGKATRHRSSQRERGAT